MLLDKGAKADIQNNSGQTPLSLAANTWHAQEVEIFLTLDKVNPNSKDYLGRSPLSWSVGIGKLAPLHKFEADAMKTLLDDDRVEVNLRDNEGRTPISLAAGEGCVEAVEVLIMDDGVDIDLADNNGWTPLQWAQEKRRREVIATLSSRK
ncbi:ankyrin [Colletotrichum sublineola]|nr:ankyrin [Colletotrichum sublineola]